MYSTLPYDMESTKQLNGQPQAPLVEFSTKEAKEAQANMRAAEDVMETIENKVEGASNSTQP